MSCTNHKAELRYDSTLSGTGVASDNGAIQSVFTYDQTPITFSKGEGLMVNATQMAKAFGKQPTHWLSSQAAEEFLSELSKLRNLSLADLVVVTRGGDAPGTWMHEDVALEFARWLSPRFAIWCNDRIKELLTTGKTELKPMSEIDLIIKSANMLKEQEARLNSVAKEVRTLKAQTSTTPDFYTVVGYASLQGVRLNIKECSRIGRKASKMCQTIGVNPGEMPDPRFGRVNTYPSCVLEEIFNEPITA